MSSFFPLVIFIIFISTILIQFSHSENDYFRQYEPLFISHSQYLFLKTENQLLKVQTIVPSNIQLQFKRRTSLLENNLDEQSLSTISFLTSSIIPSDIPSNIPLTENDFPSTISTSSSDNGIAKTKFSTNIFSFSFVYNGLTVETFDEFCQFVSHDEESGWFWIYVKMKDSPSCTLFFGEEDSVEVNEIQPQETLNQNIESSVTKLTPIFVTITFKNKKTITIVNGMRNVNGKYLLFKIEGNKFEKIVGIESNTPIILPATWKSSPSSYDNSNIRMNSKLEVETDFYFIVNNKELWKFKGSFMENADDTESPVEKIGDISFQEPTGVIDEGLSKRYLFFVPQGEEVVVISSNGNLKDTFKIFTFKTKITPTIEKGKIVPFNSDASNKGQSFYFFAKETVKKQQLVDLEGVNPGGVPSNPDAATPKFVDIVYNRSYLYRCTMLQCEPVTNMTSISEMDPAYDPITLFQNRYAQRDLFIGSKKSIRLLHNDSLLEAVVTTQDPSSSVRILYTNGFNLIFEECPSDNTPNCNLSMFRNGVIESQLYSKLTPDSVIVDYSDDGSLLQLIINNGTQLISEIMLTNISEGCSPQCVHGKCTLEGDNFVCLCEGHFQGPDCNVCKDGYSGVDCSILCNENNCRHGKCEKDLGCVCNEDDENGYWKKLNENQLCGKCKYLGMNITQGCKKYKCNSGYFGEICDLYCDPDGSCSGHGTCTSTGSCKCYSDSTNGYWTKPNCDECDVNFDENENCKSCVKGFMGQSCTIPSCYNIPANSTEVCSGRGICLEGNCECKNSYYGEQCELFQCFRIDPISPTVCNGNGKCVAPDQCVCLDGWSGQSCGEKNSSLFFWLTIIFLILVVTVNVIAVLIWKRCPHVLRTQFYKRKGFSRLDDMSYENQLYEMNEEMGSDTEDFDTEDESVAGDGYDTNDETCTNRF